MNKWGWTFTIAMQSLFLVPALSAAEGTETSFVDYVLDSPKMDSLCFGIDNLEQKGCHHHHHHHRRFRGPTGPTGPTGATGPAGSGVAAVFGSYYNDNGQVTSSTDGEPVEFVFDQVTPVGGIIHPVAANTTQFQLPNAGTYFVAWSVNYFADSAPAPGDSVAIFLFDETTATAFIPSTGFNSILDGQERTLSGQMFITVPAGEVISLYIRNTAADSVGATLTLFGPSILIQQIN